MFALSRRFTLRTLVLVILIASVGLALVTSRARRQSAIRYEAWKYYGTGVNDGSSQIAQALDPVYEALEPWVGWDTIHTTDWFEFEAVPPENLVASIHALPGAPHVLVFIPVEPVEANDPNWRIRGGVRFRTYTISREDTRWRDQFYGAESPFRDHKLQPRRESGGTVEP